jgi:transposase
MKPERLGKPVRVEHAGRDLRDYLGEIGKDTAVAMEANSGWHRFMDELEVRGMDARLVNPLEAKRRIGERNKTDKLDARGLPIQLRSGRLPEVWVPKAKLRDLRIVALPAGGAVAYDGDQEPHSRGAEALRNLG